MIPVGEILQIVDILIERRAFLSDKIICKNYKYFIGRLLQCVQNLAAKITSKDAHLDKQVFNAS